MRMMILWLGLCIASGARGEVEPVDARIAKHVQPYLDGGWAKSLCVGVIQGGARHVWGFGDAGHGKPDGKTIYEIGSATKTMTGVLIAELVRRGRISVDAPVGALLPGVKVPASGGRAITVRDLLTHRSALPRIPANLHPRDWRDPYRDYTTHDLVEELAGTRLARAPGEKYEYSNTAFALLGVLLEQLEGKPYAQLVEQKIFRPLKMDDSGVGVTRHPERAAQGHDVDGEPAPPWSFQVMAPAGAVRSTVDDMLRYAAANLEPGGDELGRALAASHAKLGTELPGQDIGSAWVLTGETVWHNGETGGCHAFVGVLPARKLAVVLLAGTSSPRLDALAFALIHELAGVPQAPVALPAARPLDPGQAQACAGRYRTDRGLELVVAAKGDGLTLAVPPNEPLRLYRSAGDRFFVRKIEAEITFHRDGAGRATALTFHAEGDEHARRID